MPSIDDISEKALNVLFEIERELVRRLTANNRCEDGLAFIDQTILDLGDDLVESDAEVILYQLRKHRVGLLLDLGRYEESLRILADLSAEGQPLHERLQHDRYLGCALRGCQRHREAVRVWKSAIRIACSGGYGGEVAFFLLELLRLERETDYRFKFNEKDYMLLREFCRRIGVDADAIGSREGLQRTAVTIRELANAPDSSAQPDD